MASEDFLGRSALRLLTYPSQTGRALFLLSATEATVGRSASSATEVCRVRIAGLTALPFRSGSFDCVVLEGELLGRPWTGMERYLGVLQEIERLLGPGGQSVVVAAHRRIPRDRGAFHLYRLTRPDKPWQTAFEHGALRTAERWRLRFEGPRLTEMSRSSGDENGSTAESPVADATAFVLQKHAAPNGNSFIQAILEEVSTRLGQSGSQVRLENVLVRKIGKTALLVTLGSGARCLIRVPRTQIALTRAQRNFAALQHVHDSGRLPGPAKNRVPRPLVEGTCGGYRYFVEDLLPGAALPALQMEHDLEPGALEFITELHETTRQIHSVDTDFFARHFAQPVQQIGGCAGLPPATHEVLRRLLEYLRGSLVGEALPIVWSHGDFAQGNCLYDRTGRLSAVVDWELFSDCGLPVLDLIQCMNVRSESSSHRRWQRFDAVCELLQRDPELMRSPALSEYVERMAVPRRSIPALLIMHWVDHVANRIDARSGDRGWMEKRVCQPLATLGDMLSDHAWQVRSFQRTN